MAKAIDKQTYEIPAKTITIERVSAQDFNYIQEVSIDYNTAKLLVEKDKPVYRKEVELPSGTKQVFFVKVSSRHYMEFLEMNVLGL